MTRRRRSQVQGGDDLAAVAAQLTAPRRRRSLPLADVAAQLTAPPRRRRSLPLADVERTLAVKKPRARTASLDKVARQIIGDEPDDVPSRTGPMDVHGAARSMAVELVAGRGHYERVIAAVAAAHTSVWIATANVKELLVEDLRAGRRRRRAGYISILAILDDLAERGVELRVLHAELPSGPFREELRAHPRLVRGGLELRRCPRVHMKLVIVDGALLYLGSANWTGAGLGAKGSGRRNFEVGIVTDDAPLLDEVQAMYQHVWSGAGCSGCRLREECPGPLDELE